MIPYWSRARVIDAVGLNTAEVARQPLTHTALDALRPEVVMFHQYRTLEPTRLAAPEGGAVQVIEPAALRRAVRTEFMPVFDEPPVNYASAPMVTTKLAPLVLAGWLHSRTDYTIVAVDYGRERWGHIYGLRNDWPQTEQVVDSLRRASKPGHYTAYLELSRRSR